MGCKNRFPDPLNGFIIGSKDSIWKDNLNTLLASEKFKKGDYEGNFKSFMIISKDTIPVEIDLNPDSYFYGKILDYKITLSSNNPWIADSLETKSFLDYSTVRNVYKAFIKKYGKPQENRPAIIYPSINDKGEFITSKEDYSEGNTVAPADFFLSTWKLKDAILEFYCGSIVKTRDSIKLIPKSYVLYTSNTYASDLQTLKDSLINTYTPSDYVTFNVQNCEISREPYNWQSPYDRSIKFLVQSIARGANEDSRDIESIRYDIFVYDSFENELFSFPDNTWDLSQPLTPNLTLMMIGSPGWELSTKYRSSAPSLAKLEKAFGSGENLYPKMNPEDLYLEIVSITRT